MLLSVIKIYNLLFILCLVINPKNLCHYFKMYYSSISIIFLNTFETITNLYNVVVVLLNL